MDIIAPSRAESYHGNTPDTILLQRKALAYAKRGVPVFRLRPGTKEPFHGSRGFYDATTDPETVRSWWRECPDANIGIPTGGRSGLLVVDVDPDEGGYFSLGDLAEEGCELPETTLIGTGGGGQHHYFAFPEDEEIRNATTGLGPGIHIRGEGGYVVAPPSVTESPYTVKKKRPLAEPPAWLLEKLTRPSRGSGEEEKNVSRIGVDVGQDGPEIPAGERNTTLFRIGCSLRARGLDAGEILKELERVSTNRCLQPLDAGELEKIAKSASRYAPGEASPETTPEVLAELDRLEAKILASHWPGVGGKSERDVMIALTRLAKMHGTEIPAGIRISGDVRTVALMAEVSKRSLLDNRKKGERLPGIISRLKAKGWIRSDNATRSGKEAGAFVLLTARAGLHHSTTTEHLRTTEKRVVQPCAPPLTAPRLRWSRPLYQGLDRIGTISRLGKSKGEIIDHLEAAGRYLTFEELADRLEGENGKRPRIRDLRRRHLVPLEAGAVVECDEHGVSLTPDWLDALNRRREEDGEIADHRRDLARYEREREAYRNRQKEAPTAHPANAGADGYTGELQRLSPRPSKGVLYRHMGHYVGTPHGPGLLWDAKGDEARVVFDSDPSKWVPLDTAELVLPEVAA